MPSTLTTCTACGSTCDDIKVSLAATGKLLQAENACPLGSQWFALADNPRPPATIDGARATLDEALDHAAELLLAARLPLVAGLRHATIEAARAAVALADQLGACIDWTAKPSDGAASLALQNIGGVTATHGEVAQRADLILSWGADLSITHPRYIDRYLTAPSSPWIAGRQDRTLVLITDNQVNTSNEIDLTLTTAHGAAFESITVLRSLLAGLPLDPQQVLQQTGLPLDTWQQLLERMKQARFGAVIHSQAFSGNRESVIALHQLMAELTPTTRWVAIPAGSAGNLTGVSNVLTWQTGFPLGVSLAQGAPEYGPHEWTAAQLLARREADAAVIVASDLISRLNLQRTDSLKQLPSVALDWRDTRSMQTATVAIRTARPGLEADGTTSRADGVMLPMRMSRRTSHPTYEEVLSELRRRIASKQPA